MIVAALAALCTTTVRAEDSWDTHPNNPRNAQVCILGDPVLGLIQPDVDMLAATVEDDLDIEIGPIGDMLTITDAFPYGWDDPLLAATVEDDLDIEIGPIGDMLADGYMPHTDDDPTPLLAATAEGDPGWIHVTEATKVGTQRFYYHGPKGPSSGLGEQERLSSINPTMLLPSSPPRGGVWVNGELMLI